VGAITGIAGGITSPWQQRKAEQQRWSQRRADELWKEERRALLDLTNLLAEGCQAASWLAWSATAKSDESLRSDIAEYDSKMRLLMPRLVTAQAAASGLSDDAYDRLDPLVQRLFALDGALADASVRFEGNSTTQAREELGHMRGAANRLIQDLVVNVRSQLRGARE
jgi:hypothetical protein